MNTQTIVQRQLFNTAMAGPRGPAVTLARLASTAARSLAAIAASGALFTGALWAATEPGLALYLQALNWSTSFIFLAVGLEAKKSSTSWLAMGTGTGILLLTGLSTRFGLEFALWGTLLICAGMTAAIFRR